MASVYTNDLRLEEIGSGEQSGTWGDTTNTNLELIAEGFSFGTEAITTNADTHTSTVADGATDPARSMYIKYTGTLDSTCTITIAPNTLSRMHFIENGTSGSQDIIISQGSGANVTIPPGDVKAVYLDGAGSGAAVVDAFASLNIGSFTSGASTITTDGNTAQLTLISTDADANAGPTLKLRRNSASPADDDLIGAIDWTSENSSGDEHDFLNLTARMRDVTAGSEDVAYAWTAYLNGTGREIQSFVNTDASAASMVFNEDAQDIDFRIESDTKPNAFSLNGATGSVGFNVLDGDVTSDGTAARTYVGIIGTGNRGRLNIGSTAVNGADSGVISFVNGANELGNINMETNSGVQNAGKMYISSTDLLTINSAGGVVFNDNSANVDFRIESNGNVNMFLVDGSADTIGIGTTQMNVVGNNAAGINLLADGMVGISRAGMPLKINRTAEGGMIELYEAGTSRGQIDIESDRILVRSGGDASGIRFDASGLTPFKNGSAADGTVDLGFASGQFRDIYLSNGVVFGAAGGANVSSETLSDYEEGVFTPALRDALAGTAAGTSSTSGRYTKIGRVVNFSFAMSLSSTSGMTATNSLNLTGLPYTVNNDSAGGGEPHAQILSFISPLSSADYGGSIILRPNNNTTSCEIKYTSGGAQTTQGGQSLQVQNISGSTYLTGSATYETT